MPNLVRKLGGDIIGLNDVIRLDSNAMRLSNVIRLDDAIRLSGNAIRLSNIIRLDDAMRLSNIIRMQ